MWIPPQRLRKRVCWVVNCRREVIYASGDGQEGSRGRSWSGPMVEGLEVIMVEVGVEA
jgi:hypothetical protein